MEYCTIVIRQILANRMAYAKWAHHGASHCTMFCQLGCMLEFLFADLLIYIGDFRGLLHD